ncbi:alpha/beta fold hydrolase [Mangrovimicrobium sediminis]|uniref:Alpha/beta fold hydrolase n=1 Tax=Mangrovimicrobium sediminis TaxID=2562682 RepID=A0A4Z0LXI6_9GAMM|nr:alpha/beta fold hydrolase [Haliea sp. SAOS-164]TGD71795.1 alpha/beta fold hydrolase [Haliea sp. SAOS-164]
MRFVLVHGGFHGAWCWERLLPELEKLGHQGLAIDLPGHGARRDERSTLADRRDAILDVLQPGDVLVGHSGGGYDITVAADAALDRVRHLVYFAAGLPLEGRSVLEATGGARDDDAGAVTQLMDDETGMLAFLQPLEDGRLAVSDLRGATDFFYHDCDAETARRAFERLTPAPHHFNIEPVHVPRFWAAQPPRSFIRCLQDRAMPASMSDSVIARLGVEPLDIDASHSPFFSQPAELAQLLVRAVATTPAGTLSPA